MITDEIARDRPRVDIRVAQIVSMSQQGLSTTQIAERLGVSAARVSYLARLAGVALPGSLLSQQQRIERISELAQRGYSSTQIGHEVGVTAYRVRQLARRERIEIVADVLNLGRVRRIDSTRVVSKTIEQADGIGALLDQVNYDALPVDEIDGWVSILDDAIGALTHLRKRLKETQP